MRLQLRTMVTRMHCHDFLGAIGLFEIVIQGFPRFAEAIDRLALCYQRKGKQLAREARHLGSSWTYNALERGRVN